MENGQNTNLNDLEFVKLKIPRLIPRELIENVKGRTFTPEQFYNLQEQQVSNPYNLLYALIDPEKKIRGFLWAILDWDNTLFINTFSIEKKYWHKGDAIAKCIEFLKPIVAEFKPQKVFWITTNEKVFIKYGFKRSKNVLMEFPIISC